MMSPRYAWSIRTGRSVPERRRFSRVYWRHRRRRPRSRSDSPLPSLVPASSSAAAPLRNPSPADREPSPKSLEMLECHAARDMQDRNHLILYVNGTRHEIRGRRAFQTLADFLRYDLQLVGTKVVCAEGDCGSCTVFIGRLDVVRNRIRYETACSCIQFLCQLDCTHIVTVEGLKYDGQLNPLQQAMVACAGAQCGFCTPGFIFSMCAMFEDRRQQAGGEDVCSACSGNLCRCTGYESILRAGASVDATKM